MPPQMMAALQAAGISDTTLIEDADRYSVESANRRPGTLTGLDCPDCLNRGYFMALDEQGCRTTVECKCMARRRSIERANRSGLGSMLERYTMDRWQTPEDWQKKAKQKAEEFLAAPSGHWFYMAGSVGAGKSHLCAAICKELLDRGYSVRYLLWRDVSVRAKAVVNEETAYQEIVQPFKSARALYIDDLFKTGKGQEPTQGDVNLAFELLNYRYNNPEKITILSSEWTLEQLMDLDAAVGSRIYERSKGFYLPVIGKQNWRLR